jgi:hypothetical protein
VTSSTVIPTSRCTWPSGSGTSSAASKVRFGLGPVTGSLFAGLLIGRLGHVPVSGTAKIDPVPDWLMA